jgi:hypothetical protein
LFLFRDLSSYAFQWQNIKMFISVFVDIDILFLYILFNYDFKYTEAGVRLTWQFTCFAARYEKSKRYIIDSLFNIYLIILLIFSLNIQSYTDTHLFRPVSKAVAESDYKHCHVMSVRPSNYIWNTATAIRRIFMKSHIWDFYEI